jgi:predicted DCC family thiol-disulfide oxidoreductase YuxK
LTSTADTSVIILFDGVCNLCSGVVHFLIRRDPKGKFRFASLQSEAGLALLKQVHINSGQIDTIVVIEGDRCYTRSAAALRIAKHLPGLWPVLYIGILIPTPLRNKLYDWVARNRYRWFGRKEQCMLPTPAIKSRFLE